MYRASQKPNSDLIKSFKDGFRERTQGNIVSGAPAQQPSSLAEALDISGLQRYAFHFQMQRPSMAATIILLAEFAIAGPLSIATDAVFCLGLRVRDRRISKTPTPLYTVLTTRGTSHLRLDSHLQSWIRIVTHSIRSRTTCQATTRQHQAAPTRTTTRMLATSIHPASAYLELLSRCRTLRAP